MSRRGKVGAGIALFKGASKQWVNLKKLWKSGKMTSKAKALFKAKPVALLGGALSAVSMAYTLYDLADGLSSDDEETAAEAAALLAKVDVSKLEELLTTADPEEREAIMHLISARSSLDTLTSDEEITDEEIVSALEHIMRYLPSVRMAEDPVTAAANLGQSFYDLAIITSGDEGRQRVDNIRRTFNLAQRRGPQL